jgi:hypothetical protein
MCCVLVRLKLCINLALNLFETEHLRNGQNLKVTETYLLHSIHTFSL